MYIERYRGYLKERKVKDMTNYEYGYYNETEKDRKYFTEKYTRRGYTDVKVKRIKTDTKGLKMYEITGIKVNEEA